jgi:hypothetical protein
MDGPKFVPGQAWTYRAPDSQTGSRIVIGAVLTFASGAVVCCAVTGAPRRLPDGTIDAATIPFLSFSEAALAETVVTVDGELPLPEGFAPALEEWHADPRGMTVFTVPFEGFLDRLIARQMAAIIGVEAEASTE